LKGQQHLLGSERLSRQQHLLASEGLDVGSNPTYLHNEAEIIEPKDQGTSVVPLDLRDESTSVINAESDDDFPHLLVHDPDDPLLENNPEVSSPTTPLHTNVMDKSASHVLPYRHNRGKPLNRYCPDIEDRRSKYPITNYVSTQRLSGPLRAFAHTLSSCKIPGKVEEVLTDPHWATAIKEELEALQKNKT
jgi:hypothetical protein